MWSPPCDWLRSDTRIRLVAGDDFLANFGLQQLLNICQQIVLVDTDERNRMTLVPGAGRAAYAVHIIFRHMRQFIVNDVR